MDFIVSYHLYTQIKKKEKEEKREILIKESIKEEKLEEQTTINYTCPKCGQNQYFCQCKNNIKTMFKYFNSEKDIY